MKIKGEMIDRFADQYCIRYYDTDYFVTSEEVATEFFRTQDTADILDFVNSRSPQDEVYLTQAMIECAERAGLLEEWMNTFDTDNKLWRQISRRLRKMIREQQSAETEATASDAEASDV